MANVAALHSNLADSVKQLSDETELLRTELYHLWDKVQVSHDERAKFLDTYPGIKTKTKQEICKEIDRCQELHKQQVTAATQDLRGKLFDLWDKCYVRDEERGAFAAFKSVDFTEKVLQEHKTEVEQYEAYHQEIQEVFNLLSRRDELYERLYELEMAALDSNRLNNRGGHLLKDEKEKKAIEKVNGELLTINHRPVLDIINEQWESKRQLKEAEKKSKLSEAGKKDSCKFLLPKIPSHHE
ncbi:protein regulator of cytokinesis 1-like isoform X2 [Neocloeon triangulifer]|uniref:protein regulator of cytokinesis 1-like isoform X2 n=1 Tax=Neocloeon triangulifer TaxID=2078957 RepID=UPI00286F7C55|nr:protein regulator of cytokinesis 1-like isoform X2 [Neocloeon triangulifer]